MPDDLNNRSNKRHLIAAVVIACAIVALFVPTQFWRELIGPSGYSKQAAKKTTTLSNVMLIARGLMLYVDNHGGTFPAQLSSGEDVQRLLSGKVPPRTFLSLNPNGGEFIPNRLLASKSRKHIATGQVLIVESKPGSPRPLLGGGSFRPPPIASVQPKARCKAEDKEPECY